MKAALPILLFLVLAACVWLPFTSHDVVFNPGLDRNRPAGQITEGFSLSEAVPALMPDSSPADEQADCIALRFATYMRRNEGSVQVNWSQGDRGHRWVLDASRLEDNSYVDLCLDRPMDAAAPFILELSGLDGKPGSAATVWLTAQAETTTRVNGRDFPGVGLALRLSKQERVGPRDILGLNGGAFAAGFLCSVLIGILALLCFFHEDRRPQQALSDDSNACPPVPEDSRSP
jgi:hypothetical protein